MSRGWLHLASGAGVGRILGFVCNLALSRILGPEALGSFNLVATTIQNGDTLIRLGADYALNYELGSNPDLLKSPQGQSLVRAFVQICSFMTFILCLLLGIWFGFGDQILFPSESTQARGNMLVLLILILGFEGFLVAGWELVLISRNTARLALRQGLFFPLRLVLSSLGAFYLGLFGAILGWVVCSFVQFLWLKHKLAFLWNPLGLFPCDFSSIKHLLRRGIPFYGSNLASAFIFFPMLLAVANQAGLSDLGYLRVGQIMQQLFALLPSTLVPVLFLELRSKNDYKSQVQVLEKPLRLIWLTLLVALLLYCLFDSLLIDILFGREYLQALTPTRILLLTSMIECLGQLLIQPILASGKTLSYLLWQNGAVLICAFLGWVFLPYYGLYAYLAVRFIYVLLPTIAFGFSSFSFLAQPMRVLSLSTFSFLVVLVILYQAIQPTSSVIGLASSTLLVSLVLFQKSDFLTIIQSLKLTRT